MAAKKKIKTYEVYTVSCGVKNIILTTTDKKECEKTYSRLCYTGALPRIAIDGRQLTIAESYEFDNVVTGSKTRWGKYARRPEITRNIHRGEI